MNQDFNPNNPAQAYGSGDKAALLLDVFRGKVTGTLKRETVFESFINFEQLVGTDTLTNKHVSGTVLGTLINGQTPQTQPITFGKTSVTVDTVMLARNAIGMLDNAINDFDHNGKISMEQAKLHANFIDEAVAIQLVKAAGSSAIGTTEGAPLLDRVGGVSVQLSGANDHLDADLLEAGIRDVVTALKKNSVRVNEMRLFVDPTEYDRLSRADKVVSTDFSDGNGNYSGLKIERVASVQVTESVSLPRSTSSGHLLDQASGGTAYDVSATEAKIMGIVAAPEALMAATAVPLTAEFFRDPKTKAWYIDSYHAFNVAVDEREKAGRLLKN